MRVEPQPVKKPRTSSVLEAAFCAVWNAKHAAKDRFECMGCCEDAINACDNLWPPERQMIREKIGEAQEYWGLQ